jgi:hypothetical protein
MIGSLLEYACRSSSSDATSCRCSEERSGTKERNRTLTFQCKKQCRKRYIGIVCVYLCIYIYTSISIQQCVYMYLSLSMYTYMCMHTHTHIYIHIYIHTYIYIYVYIYIYIYIYIHIYIHTHANVPPERHAITYMHGHTHMPIHRIIVLFQVMIPRTTFAFYGRQIPSSTHFPWQHRFTPTKVPCSSQRWKSARIGGWFRNLNIWTHPSKERSIPYPPPPPAGPSFCSQGLQIICRRVLNTMGTRCQCQCSLCRYFSKSSIRVDIPFLFYETSSWQHTQREGFFFSFLPTLL